ncbi:class I SAM-dependent methyltransferase [Patescibacteria group bacterium AH-259-L05]|nr:class I SAM-dependent methyltransferase [Patescibacteria group bacterium AH-259-L05]
MDSRKQEEAKFHNKVRNKTLENDVLEYEYLTSNKKIYSVTRKSRKFVNNWIIQNCPNKRALDYCCGNGAMTIFLAKKGAQATGIDISDISIQNCNKLAIKQGVEKNTSFLVMDAEKLNFEDNYFDIIVCCGVLHHLDVKKVYPELARVLKPQGKVICNEPLVYNPIFQLYRKMTPHLRTEWEMRHILSKNDIMIAKKNFNKIEDIKFFHLTTVLAIPFHNLPGFNVLLRSFEIIDSILLRIPLLKWLAWQTAYILSEPRKHSINKND